MLSEVIGAKLKQLASFKYVDSVLFYKDLQSKHKASQRKNLLNLQDLRENKKTLRISAK